jgi:hypothetical protein
MGATSYFLREYWGGSGRMVRAERRGRASSDQRRRPPACPPLAAPSAEESRAAVGLGTHTQILSCFCFPPPQPHPPPRCCHAPLAWRRVVDTHALPPFVASPTKLRSVSKEEGHTVPLPRGRVMVSVCYLSPSHSAIGTAARRHALTGRAGHAHGHESAWGETERGRARSPPQNTKKRPRPFRGGFFSQGLPGRRPQQFGARRRDIVPVSRPGPRRRAKRGPAGEEQGGGEGKALGRTRGKGETPSVGPAGASPLVLSPPPLAALCRPAGGACRGALRTRHARPSARARPARHAHATVPRRRRGLEREKHSRRRRRADPSPPHHPLPNKTFSSPTPYTPTTTTTTTTGRTLTTN